MKSPNPRSNFFKIRRIRQVKDSFLNLDLSHITIDVEGQTPARLVEFEGIDELFTDDINPDP